MRRAISGIRLGTGSPTVHGRMELKSVLSLPNPDADALEDANRRSRSLDADQRDATVPLGQLLRVCTCDDAGQHLHHGSVTAQRHL